MKVAWSKYLLIFAALFITASGHAGGEIPWPLSQQMPVSAKNSQGVWIVSGEHGFSYYNVEILDSNDDGYSWMRVSEIDTKTGEVISFGEGFYCKESIAFDTLKYSVDNPGRYLYMFPESDLSKDPYLLRLVEVKLDYGVMLGMSYYPLHGEEPEHFLGYRVLTDSLACYYDGEHLSCDVQPLEEMGSP